MHKFGLGEQDPQPLIIDTGGITRRIKREMKSKPDVWRLVYGRDCTYVLEFLRTADGAVVWWMGSYDLDELLQECRVRGLQGVRKVVKDGKIWDV